MTEINKVVTHLETDEGEIIIVRRNMIALYRHMGKKAMYDHVYIDQGTLRDNTYVWEYFEPDRFQDLVILAHAYECEMHVNLPEVNHHDIKTFDAHLGLMNLDIDTIPADWA